MNKKIELDRINNLLSLWFAQIKINTKLDFYDINKLSEGLCAKLLNTIYDYKLIDLNKIKKNFPGIDLGDTENKIAFQVTSRVDFDKFKENLEKFVEKNKDNKSLSDTFSNGIRFLVLNFEQIKNGRINLNTIYSEFIQEKHIIKLDDLLTIISDIYDNDKNKFKQVKFILEEEFGHNSSNQDNLKNEFIPEMIFAFTEKFHIVNNEKDIELLLQEIQLILNKRDNNFVNIIIQEEIELKDELEKLNFLPNTTENRKKIIDIENILQYFEKCKDEIVFSIKYLLNLFAFNISKNYKLLTISLLELVELFFKPQITIEETELIYIMEDIKAINYDSKYKVNGTKFDVWQNFGEDRLVLVIYLDDFEIDNLQKKSPIKRASKKDFFDSLIVMGLDVSDLELDTIAKKVIPKFLTKLYDKQDLLKNENKDNVLNLNSYNLGLG